MAAADHGDSEIVDLLLDAGADPGLARDDGTDAASLADGKDHGGVAARLRALSR